MEVTDINALKEDIKKSFEKIEDGFASKVTLAKLEEELKALKKYNERQYLENKSDPIFGTKATAQDFVNVLHGAIAKSYLTIEGRLTKESPFHVSKADLNSYGSGTGVELIPTATSNVLSVMLLQESVMRSKATHYADVQGNLNLTRRNGTSSVVFTANSGLKEDAAVTPGSFGVATISIGPKQLSGLSLVSEKLLYGSAVPIAQNIALDLMEQAGYRENYVCYKGDGTADANNGGITGLKTLSGIDETVNPPLNDFAADPIQYMLALLNKVHQSVQDDPNAEYLISSATDVAIRQSKATTSGTYHFNPQANSFQIGGRNVKVWHVMDAGDTLNQVPVIFGNFRKGVTIATGRDMGIEVSRDYKFANNQAAFRLTYDFDMDSEQPTALARIKVAASDAS